jgi:cytochrome c peroxidase
MKSLTVSFAAAIAALGLIAAAQPYDFGLPAGVAGPTGPAGNQMSPARFELGRRLFYDANLSANGALACATCHEQRYGFAESIATHPGVTGAPGRRNAQGLANVAYLSPLTWADPGTTTLEAQVATPLTGEHPVEMGMAGKESEIVRRLGSDACYRSMFKAAYPGQPIGMETMSKALAAFERSLISADAPYDRYRRGAADALTAEAKYGLAVFQANGCAGCHSGPDLTDAKFHVVAPLHKDDPGVFEKTGRESQRAAFRTPPLRNVMVSAPYSHDGSSVTVRAAILDHVWLTDSEVAAVETFLGSMTDQTFLNNERFSRPSSFCGKSLP